MRGLHRSVRVVVVASAAAIVLTACSDETGDPLPGDPNTPPTTQASTAPPSEPGQSAGELGTVKACSLLTDQEIETISKGFEVIREGPRGGSSDSCSWGTESDQISIDKYIVLGIDVRPAQTLDQLNVGLGKATDGEVEGRKAKLVSASAGENSCALAFVAEKGRVDIVIEAKPTDRACQIASDVSTLIEPKLPKPTA
jgi:hypothetical protein